MKTLILALTSLVLLSGCGGQGIPNGLGSAGAGSHPFVPDGHGNVVCSVFDISGYNFTALPDFDTLDEINHENDMFWPSINVVPSTSADKFEPFIGSEFDNLKTNFGVRCGSRIVIPQTGDYTFTLESEDGSQLFIDGIAVVDNDGIHGDQSRSGTVHLTAGNHKFRAIYFVTTNGKGLKLSSAFNAGPSHVLSETEYTLEK